MCIEGERRGKNKESKIIELKKIFIGLFSIDFWVIL